LTKDDRMQLETARASRAVDYGIVRAIKIRALREGFEHFRTTEWNAGTRRAQRLKLFMDRARWWLDDYALFRALHAREDGRYWREWPEEIRDRQAAALTRARQELAGEIFFYSYLQWRCVRDRRVWRLPVHGER
jgi:4-alpha-glucanotransferase